jgi:HK97 family phage prohead protease
MLREQRDYAFDRIEVRDVGDGAPPVIDGHAAVFDQLSEDLGGFREIIKPGSFLLALAASDVRALWNHNPDFVLGRQSSGTVTVVEDDRGLGTSINPPDTQLIRDMVLTPMRRGDVNQASFGFWIDKDEWSTMPDGTLLRTIIAFRELFDVSPVTFPAYPQTRLEARAVLTNAGLDFDALAHHIAISERPAVWHVNERDRQLVIDSIDVLNRAADSGESGAPDPETVQASGLIAIRRRLLTLREREATI